MIIHFHPTLIALILIPFLYHDSFFSLFMNSRVLATLSVPDGRDRNGSSISFFEPQSPSLATEDTIQSPTNSQSSPITSNEKDAFTHSVDHERRKKKNTLGKRKRRRCCKCIPWI